MWPRGMFKYLDTFGKNLGNISHVSCRAGFTYIMKPSKFEIYHQLYENNCFSLQQQQQLEWFHKTFTDISTVLSWYVNF